MTPREDGWDELRREIEALPKHAQVGYDCEWWCDRDDGPRPHCSFPEQHEDEMVSRAAVLRLLAAARGEPGLREALDAFFEDIDADWANDNIRPGTFAFRFRHAADRLRAALAATPAPREPDALEAALERERDLRQALLEGSYFHIKHDGTPRHPETCNDCRAIAERGSAPLGLAE